MQELLRKEYELEIKVDGKSFTFKYKQAKFSELLDFDYYLKLQDEKIVQHIFGLLKKWGTNFDERLFHKIDPKTFKTIFDFIIKTYGKGFYDFKEEKKGENSKKQPSAAPFSSLLAFILKNTNETLESLNNMTWESINYISEGIIYNLNEETKEGKELNKKNLMKKDIDDGKFDDTLDKLKENRAKVMAKFNSKK